MQKKVWKIRTFGKKTYKIIKIWTSGRLDKTDFPDTKYQFPSEILRIKTCTTDTFISRRKSKLIWNLKFVDPVT